MESIRSWRKLPDPADPFSVKPFTAEPAFATDTVFRRKPFNPERWREWIRGSVALLAVAAFAVVVVSYLRCATTYTGRGGQPDARWSQVKDAMRATFPAVTVLGTILGFYFGLQKSGTA